MVNVKLLDVTAAEVGQQPVLGIVEFHLQDVVKSLRRKHILGLGEYLLTIAEGDWMSLVLLEGQIADDVATLVLKDFQHDVVLVELLGVELVLLLSKQRITKKGLCYEKSRSK